MTPRENTIVENGSVLKYVVWQGGQKPLLCFHGFGQDKTYFKPVYEALKATHTVYSFDVFFHGESIWAGKEKPLRKEGWAPFMQAFFRRYEIDQCDVMGFSLGGKFAMITAGLFPEKVDHLHLLAPDGIKTHFSYRFSTYPYLLRKLFKTQVKWPWIFRSLVTIAGVLKLVDGYTLKFAMTQMESRAKRRLVYFSWVVFRHFSPDLKQLADIINQRKVNLTLYLGRYDRVINQKETRHLTQLLHQHELTELPCGHGRMIETAAQRLSNVKKEVNGD